MFLRHSSGYIKELRATLSIMHDEHQGLQLLVFLSNTVEEIGEDTCLLMFGQDGQLLGLTEEMESIYGVNKALVYGNNTTRKFFSIESFLSDLKDGRKVDKTISEMGLLTCIDTSRLSLNPDYRFILEAEQLYEDEDTEQDGIDMFAR